MIHPGGRSPRRRMARHLAVKANGDYHEPTGFDCVISISPVINFDSFHSLFEYGRLDEKECFAY